MKNKMYNAVSLETIGMNFCSWVRGNHFDYDSIKF